MKVFISVDMEGISGVVDGSQTGRDKAEYRTGRALMVADVNAAIDGILEVVPEAEIVVSDAHGGMRNIEPEVLNKAAVLVRGTPKPLTQMAGIDSSFDAVFFVGYHAKKGTKHGVLSHTISGRTIESVTINGMEVGETAINAGIAGHFGVPLVFLAGDQSTAQEAKELDPGIEVAVVKEAIGRTSARCLHPDIARALIRENATKALKGGVTVKPFVFKTPVEIVVRFTNSRLGDAVEFMPSAERLDGKGFRFIQNDFLGAFNALRASIFIASAVST
ncbi:MAG: M55 family metallopeptidase [Candidatus Bathyarchaeota archaeon]|jgi:D-amino peptidase|nr:M55 family metallopeptidase [Candidatus Bathyarchaeota archaeon]MDP7207180.1 M55 family metallopeptidase [Candidatus Bathyarchaeota archaeon]MDP7443651.1 M55 family metallopeptidase [Candidatus Bathyarchaeota archaeon]|tara:strand:- start:1127 stop:1954 length:828 start_codon:yes stop_codon:yes gene_type:complete